MKKLFYLILALQLCFAGIVSSQPVLNNFPEKFNLYQNYPNPFNPVTKIKFDVPTWNKASMGIMGNTKITLYDGAGRSLYILIDEMLTAGIYEITFDGSQYSSGIYYYRLESNLFSQVNKMVLVK